MPVAWPGSFWVSVGSWSPPGNKLWVLWALHCCLGLEAGLEPSEKCHQLGSAMMPAAPWLLSPVHPDHLTVTGPARLLLIWREGLWGAGPGPGQGGG